jgi:hypothetical protein
VILVLISPRNAGLPVAQWLSEESGQLVAVTAAGVEIGDGFAEVVVVADYTDDDAVLDAARAAAKRHRPRRSWLWPKSTSTEPLCSVANSTCPDLARSPQPFTATRCR